MTDFKIIHPADEELLQIVYKELGEDPDRLKNRQELFKQWIDCEDHLPKDIDQRVINNFIRNCKFDIERAKNKFELWLYARVKYSDFYTNPTNNKELTIHRQVLCMRNLTEDGSRVIIISFRDVDVERFDCDSYMRYGTLYIDYYLMHDVYAGCKIIIDMEGLTAQVLAKINLSLFKITIDVVIKAQALRLREIHVLNIPKVAHGLYVMGSALLPDKIKKRIVLHKDVSTILNYIKPNSILPNEYGGSDGNFRDLADKTLELLANDEHLHTERTRWTLAGELPTDKQKKYNLQDYGAAGSFRQLQID